jgi:tetratricopeptide (TPR) repeat protein
MIFVHAHSTPLNILAETGLVGFLAALGLAVSLVLALRRRWQQAAGSDLAVVMGASAALATYAVHGIFDSFQTEPIGLWLLAIVLGSALGGGERPSAPAQQPFGKVLFARPWWVIVFLAGVWLNIWLLQPLSEGVEAMNSSRPAEALVYLEQAVERDPHSTVAWQQLGQVRAFLAKDEAGARLAIAALERAAAMDPAWGFNLGNLGALYRTAGDLPTARRYMEQSFVLADVPVFHLNLAIIAEEQGDLQTARREYALALAGYDGNWEGDFWDQSPLRQEIRAASSAQPVFSAEDVARLEADLAADPSTLSRYLPLVQAYLASGRVDDAARVMKKARFPAVMGDRQRSMLDRVLMQVAEAQERSADAEQHRQELVMNCLMQGFAGPGGSITQYYDTIAFRKPAIFIEMVPQMVRMPCP